MTNLHSLKKEIEELKAKTNKKEEGTGFDILQSYMDGELSYNEALELLETHNYSFGDVCIMILESCQYTDEEKREMMKKEKV